MKTGLHIYNYYNLQTNAMDPDKYNPTVRRIVRDIFGQLFLCVCADYLYGTLTCVSNNTKYTFFVRCQGELWDFCDDQDYLNSQGYIGIVLNVPNEPKSIEARHSLVNKFFKGVLNLESCIQYILKKDEDKYEIIGEDYINERLQEKPNDDYSNFGN